jgi:multidrug efflux pump subunit AcrB
MKKAMAWMAANHVAANILMLVFVVGGLITGQNLRQEVFPELSLDVVSISVGYPGASPAEIEQSICLPVEEGLAGLEGMKKLTCQATEGIALVYVQVREGSNVDTVLDDVRSHVDRISTFPEESQDPVIASFVAKQEVVSVVVYGDVSERQLRRQAELIKDELQSFPEITQAELSGVRDFAMSVEISESTLNTYKLTLDSVAQRIKAESLDLPAGILKSPDGEILLRTKERKTSVEGFNGIVLASRPDGTVLRLGDIATIRDDFEESYARTTFNGQPAAMVKIFRTGEERPTDIADRVESYIAEKNRDLPPGVRVAKWNDTSEILKSRFDLLFRNGLQGLLLVFICLALFLEIRLAFWVMLGIPISFLGALLFLPSLGVSINMITLFAFILVLGIVVDDAIVIGESIYTERERGKPMMRAAIDGCQKVAVPVIFAILTTMCAFSPLLGVSGVMGKFLYSIPVIVIGVIAISLIEGLFVLPSHLTLGSNENLTWGPFRFLVKLREAVDQGFKSFTKGWFTRITSFCVRHRYTTLASAVAILALTLSLVGSGFVKFVFMPQIEADVVIISIDMKPGTPIADTEAFARRITETAQTLLAPFDEQLAVDTNGSQTSNIRNTFFVLGSQLSSPGPGIQLTRSASNIAEIRLQFHNPDVRNVLISEFASKLEQSIEKTTRVESVTFATSLVPSAKDIEVQLSHEDPEALDVIIEEVKRSLATFEGTREIADSDIPGKPEYQFEILPEARTLGITAATFAAQLRSAYYGNEALSFLRGGDEIKVIVRYPEDERSNHETLYNMRIRTAQGSEVPLFQAAKVSEARGYSTIRRIDGRRVVNVSARVDSRDGNAQQIVDALKRNTLSELKRRFPKMQVRWDGQQADQEESLRSLLRGFGLALLAIYSLLAVLFRSYAQPLIVMSAIPFGFAGAILGHMLLGFPVSFLSLFGIVGLAGVVVNDSLILIDFINENRKYYPNILDATLAASRERLRAIFLTSITTFAGLAPLLFETSLQAQFLIPMAISLGVGIMFATFIILVLVPSLYMVLMDITGHSGKDARTDELDHFAHADGESQ